jgi:hypothetical protein
MTLSVDPNNKNHGYGQLNDTYDWNALIQNRHGDENMAHNPIQASIAFLNRFISYESLYGDSLGAREMVKVTLLLQGVDNKVTTQHIAQTQKSYEYISAYRDMLIETQAPTDVVLEFERLQTVLESLLQLRQQAGLGVMCSYGALNQTVCDRLAVVQ